MSNKLRSFLIVVISIAVVMVALPMNAFRVNAGEYPSVSYWLDADASTPVVVDTSATVLEPTDSALGFEKFGYTFNGWNTAPDGNGTPYSANTTLTDTDNGINLYAQWTFDSTNYVKVTLHPHFGQLEGVGASVNDVVVAKAGTGIAMPSSWKAPAHFRLSNWTVDEEGNGSSYPVSNGSYTLADGDTTLYAQWKEFYTITFDANNGSGDKIPDTRDKDDQTDHQLKPDTQFTYEGYNFAGWWSSPSTSSGVQYTQPIPASEIKNDFSIYAHWTFDTANYHKVTYYADEAKSSEYVQPVAKSSTEFNLINAVDSGKLKAPAGKMLVSWNTQADGEGISYTITEQIETQKLAADGDLVLYAQWDDIPYTIRFMSEDGNTPLETLICHYGDTPSFSKTNPDNYMTEQYVYVFDGWSDKTKSTGSTLSSFPVVTADADYYAHFKPTTRHYKITTSVSDEAGGTISYSGSDEWEGTVTVSVALENGYRVQKWTDNGTDVASEAITYTIDSVKCDHTVEAVLEPIPYTISVNATEGGEVTVQDNLVYGNTAKAVATANNGYTFVRWIENDKEVSPNAEYSFTVTGNRTLTAVFEINSYEISLSSDGHGSVEGADTYNYFTPITVKAIPDTGYEFLYWIDEDGTKITSANYDFTVVEDRDLTAYFAPKSYNIDVEAEDHGSVTGSGIYLYAEEVTVKAKPETGYHFVNWTSNGNVVSTNANYTFTVSGPTELTANFAINTYTVKFVNDDGTLLREGEFVYGSTAFYQVNATPTKKATAQYTYTFAGWDKKLGTVTEDITYTAVYDATVNKYKITFQNEDGSVLQTGEVEYGKLPVFEKGTPTKASTVQESFTFAGWDKEISKVTGEAVYTATYTSKKITRDDLNYLHFTVSFESNGGSEVVSQLVADGGVAFKPEEPMRERYTFGGWYIDAALTKPFSFSTPITSDITLYAKWIKGSPEVEATYAVVGLGNMTWTEGSDEDFSVTIERSKDNDTISSHFKGVQIDGVDLDYYLYELSEENGTVIIRSDAFDDLDAGTHTITIVYDDGTAEAELVISKADKTVETSDEPTPTEAGGGEPEVLPAEKPSLLGLWIALAVIGGVVICVLPIIIIKRRGVK